MSEPRVTFAFGTRGLARVKRDIQEVQNIVARGANATAGRGAGPASARSASAERAAQRLALLELAKRGGAYRAIAVDAQRAEAVITAAVLSGGQRRTRAGQEEARNRIRTWRDVGRMYAQVEKDATRTAEREAGRRRAAAERQRERGGRAGQQLAGQIGQFAGQAHGTIQDARAQFAGAERTALRAFRGGGAGATEANARVRELLQFSRDNGLNFAEVAQAAAESQGQFSTLQGANPAARTESFRRFQRSALFARDSGNDLGEMTRLQGFFQQENFDAGLQDQLMRFTAAAANRGSVEAGTLTSQALQPIVSRIRTAQAGLGPNATQADRNRVAFDTYRQGVAELEVTALGGVSARNGGNALSSAARFLTDPTRQDKMFTNIQNARGLSRQQRTALTRALFTTDAQGHRSLSTTNIMDFVERFQGVVGNNPTMLNNVFAGGGHGNPQSFLQNQRNAMGLLMSVDAQGRNRVRDLMGADVTMTDAELREGAGLFGNDTTAQLNRDEAARLQGLTDNTNALNQLSNRLAQLAGEHPLAAPLVQAGAGYLGSKLLGAAGKTLFGAGGGGGGAAGGAGLLGGGALATALLGGGAIAATAGALALQNRDVSARTGTTTLERADAFLSGGGMQEALGAYTDARVEQIARDADRTTANANWNPSVLGGGAPVVLSPASINGLAAALRASPLMVQVSPQAAAQAAGQQRTEATANRNRT